jgi:hypothetical protein
VFDLAPRTTARSFIVVLAAIFVAAAAARPAGKVPTLVFPVIGPVQYTDDFGDARWQGSHQGNDIMAPRKAVAVAAEAGRVKFHTTSAAAGCMLYLYGQSGTTYMYIHLNNDLGTGNDNKGKCVAGTSYWPDLRDGAKVQAGQPIGYVGDSGDANGVGPHLHFEVHPNGGGAVSPFPYLNRAQRVLFYAVPGSTVTLSLTGTVVASSAEALTLKVSLLRVFPGTFKARNVPQQLTLAVPTDSISAYSAAADSLAGKKVVVLSTPFQASPESLLGKGLTAARVALIVSGP